MSLFHPKGSIRVTTSMVGARSEQYIIAKLMTAGYEPLKPVREGLRYDLVIEDADGHFWRIQCKTGRFRTTNFKDAMQLSCEEFKLPYNQAVASAMIEIAVCRANEFRKSAAAPGAAVRVPQASNAPAA